MSTWQLKKAENDLLMKIRNAGERVGVCIYASVQTHENTWMCKICETRWKYVSVYKVRENTWVCVPFYGMRIYARLIWPLAFPRVETAHLHSLILYVFRDTASHVLCPRKKKFFYIFFRERLGSTGGRPIHVFRIQRLLSSEAWFDENFAYRAQDKD